MSTGNAGISIALVGAVKGYSVTTMMPEKASEERKKILEALGAQVILIPRGTSSVFDALKRLEEIKKSKRVWIPGQFTSPDNLLAHFSTTCPGIVSIAGKNIDAFVVGVGTGGTLMGAAKHLRAEGINA